MLVPIYLFTYKISSFIVTSHGYTENVQCVLKFFSFQKYFLFYIIITIYLFIKIKVNKNVKQEIRDIALFFLIITNKLNINRIIVSKFINAKELIKYRDLKNDVNFKELERKMVNLNYNYKSFNIKLI